MGAPVIHDRTTDDRRLVTIQGRRRRWVVRIAPVRDMHQQVIGSKAHLCWRSTAVTEDAAIDEAVALIARLEGATPPPA
jgi:hypothetical protein